MKCSVCETELVDSGLIEVSAHPMEGSYITTKWTCPNHPEIFWNDTGDIYTECEYWETKQKLIHKNNLKNAIGSFARQLEVEIFKHDEDKRIKLPFHWILKFEAKYKSNENGDILSRKWKIRWIYKNTYFYSGTWKCIVQTIKMLKAVFLYQTFGKQLSEVEVSIIFGLNVVKYHDKKGMLLYRKISYWLAPKAGIKAERN